MRKKGKRERVKERGREVNNEREVQTEIISLFSDCKPTKLKISLRLHA